MLKHLLKALGISTGTSDTKSPERENVSQNTNLSRDLELEGLLISVAKEFEDRHQFQKAARDVASGLAFERAEKLTKYFHDTPPEPDSLKEKTAKYGLLGVWMNICQNSIFEILYHYKEKAIPTLYAIGFGPYDWTQYKAIDVLCRLAHEGIQTNEIITEIGKNIDDFRYEAVFPSIESLAGIPNREDIPKIILQVFDEYSTYDPMDGLGILRILAFNYPDVAKSKLAFMKSIAKGEGNEVHRINAAILHYDLDPEDQEINELLEFWEKNAQQEAHRDRIIEFRKKKNEAN